jgi:hypothetical protein
MFRLKDRFTAILLLSGLVYGLLLFCSVRAESQTNDESAHIASGYSYWLKRDFRLNPEHPPLSKLISTIPLLFLKPEFPTDATAWRNADEFRIGQELLYSSKAQVQQILLSCRTMTVLFTVIFVICAALWVRHAISTRAAILFFILLVLDPNIAAHGRYVTSDIYVTAFYFLGCAFWFDWLKRRQTNHLVLASLTLGLAFVSKFNALLLLPTFFVMWLYYRTIDPAIRNHRRVSVGRTTLILLCIPAALILAAYAGDTRAIASDPLVRSRLEAKGRAPKTFERISVPGYYWFRGIQLVGRHEHTGHRSYLMGQFSQAGFLSYFPVAILVKTPTGTLLLTLVTVIAGVGVMQRKRKSLAQIALPTTLLIPPVLYLAVAMISHIDIGIRHILLIYPFLYVFLAWFFDQVLERGRLWTLLVAVGVTINFAEVATVYPSLLAFFNFMSGGPGNGARYLLDSNIDWGQGMIDLRSVLERTPHSCVALHYFGRAETSYYVGETTRTPATVTAAKSQSCLIAVSVQYLYDPEQQLGYLRSFKPIAKPSYSIYLYDPKRF